jgi:hypothetical protein
MMNAERRIFRERRPQDEDSAPQQRTRCWRSTTSLPPQPYRTHWLLAAPAHGAAAELLHVIVVIEAVIPTTAPDGGGAARCGIRRREDHLLLLNGHVHDHTGRWRRQR